MRDSDPLADSALLIIDVINDFSFPGADQLVRQMPPVVDTIDAVRHRADAMQRPVIHINDNFGRQVLAARVAPAGARSANPL